MLTVAVDLAAQDANTGVCLVRWRGREARVLEARAGVSDDCVLRLAAKAARGGRPYAGWIHLPSGGLGELFD